MPFNDGIPYRTLFGHIFKWADVMLSGLERGENSKNQVTIIKFENLFFDICIIINQSDSCANSRILLLGPIKQFNKNVLSNCVDSRHQGRSAHG